jgi:hypothetical protein
MVHGNGDDFSSGFEYEACIEELVEMKQRSLEAMPNQIVVVGDNIRLPAETVIHPDQIRPEDIGEVQVDDIIIRYLQQSGCQWGIANAENAG